MYFLFKAFCKIKYNVLGIKNNNEKQWCDILGIAVSWERWLWNSGWAVKSWGGHGESCGLWNTVCDLCQWRGEEPLRTGGQRTRSISLGKCCSFTLFLASCSSSLLVFVMWSFCFLSFFFYFSPVCLGFAEMSTPFSPCQVLLLNLDFISESLSAAQFEQSCLR